MKLHLSLLILIKIKKIKIPSEQCGQEWGEIGNYIHCWVYKFGKTSLEGCLAMHMNI